MDSSRWSSLVKYMSSLAASFSLKPLRPSRLMQRTVCMVELVAWHGRALASPRKPCVAWRRAIILCLAKASRSRNTGHCHWSGEGLRPTSIPRNSGSVPGNRTQIKSLSLSCGSYDYIKNKKNQSQKKNKIIYRLVSNFIYRSVC